MCGQRPSRLANRHHRGCRLQVDTLLTGQVLDLIPEASARSRHSQSASRATEQSFAATVDVSATDHKIAPIGGYRVTAADQLRSLNVTATLTRRVSYRRLGAVVYVLAVSVRVFR